MPPIIVYGNLDGQIISENDSGKKEMKYTSLASMSEENRYAYYSVQARNARNYIYQSSNLVEGYLWQALQDGIISVDHLNDTALNFIKKYTSGEFSKPISNVNRLIDVNIQKEYNSPKRYSLAYLIGINKSEDNLSSYSHIVSRYQQPCAFKDENISLIDFFVFVSQIMHIQGEPVLTETEQKILTAAYSSYLPSTMSTEYYDTILYLFAHGIIDNSYTADKLYQSLTWKDMYIILSRVADKDSRLTYKTVTVPFDLNMAEDGFIPVIPKISEINPFDIKVNVQEHTYKDIFLIKDKYTQFIDKDGKEDTPFISKQFNTASASYGILMDNNYDEKYYWFRIYNNIPIPDSYKQILDKDFNNINSKDTVILQSNKQKIHCYSIYSHNTNKILYIENNFIKSGIYCYDNKDNVCKFSGNSNEAKFVSLSGIDNIILTANEEKIISDKENILFEFKLKMDIDLEKVKINGLSKSEWIEVNDFTVETDLIPPNEIEKSKAVWVQYNKNKNYAKFAVYIEGNIPDNYESIVSSKIQYTGDYTDNNYLSYVRRNSSRDVYYSSSFLKSELGIVLSVNEDNKSYTLQMPNEKIDIQYKENSGWLCYSGNSLLKFNSTIPAVKEMKREDTTDRYLIHGLVIEHYLRSRYQDGWSTFIGTDGYLHISYNKAELEFQNMNSNIYNFLTPTDGVNYETKNILYKYTVDNSYWLDLRSVSAPLSNYIIF